MTTQLTWRKRLQQVTYGLVALCLLVASPATLVYADDEVPVADAPTTSTPEASAPAPQATTVDTPPPAEEEPVPGPQQPPGAESPTYTYNETTGLWENDAYTWDPDTKQTAPKTAPEYSYNPATGRWDTTEYIYDASSGTYIPHPVSVAAPPQDAIVTNAPDNAQPISTPAQVQALAQSTSPSSATSSVNENSQDSGIFDLFYNAVISNHLSSLASSGDALVAMNTLAGDAMSGSVSAMATIINLLHSTWSMAAGSFNTFVGNLFGDIIGDLFLDPGSLSGGSGQLAQNTTVHVSENAAINNTIELEANSGDATVKQNTQAGSAQSGDASVIANLINAINSSVSANQSFVGMLNVFGNLNGDILLPDNLIDTLIAANAVGTLDTSQISNSDVLANFNNNQTIVNNIDASATSGNSTVNNNTNAGNATTGNADTNITLLNLTGRQVVGKNALLVFVNVMGRWVGVIVDAPTGATSAALGSGITDNSSLAITGNSNQAITNNVVTAATSGDATVEQNTAAGDATSGDAHAAINVLNINGSNFSLSDWFGILFINVFGSWTGSFGINTDAGTVTLPSTTQSIITPEAPVAVNQIQAFRFIPDNNSTYALESTDEGPAALASAKVLSTDNGSTKAPQKKADFATSKQSDWMFSLIGIVVAASLLGTERVLSNRAHRKLS